MIQVLQITNQHHYQVFMSAVSLQIVNHLRMRIYRKVDRYREEGHRLKIVLHSEGANVIYPVARFRN